MAHPTAVECLASLALLLPLSGAGLQLQFLPGQPAGGAPEPRGYHGGLSQSFVSHNLGIFQAPHVMVAPLLDKANGTGPFVTVSYYKTGTGFSLQLHWQLFNITDPDAWMAQFYVLDYVNDSFTDDRYSAIRSRSEPITYHEEWPLSMRQSYHVMFPTDLWPLPLGARTVHWVRDPIKQILSAYRYNRKESMESPNPEMYLVTQGKCGSCDWISHHAIFELCNYTCTYKALLDSLPEESGVLVEATHESAALQSMVANTERWANNPDVLFLTVDHLSLDFNRTMECMIDFAGISEGPGLMDRLQLVNAQVADPYHHATRGKYDNAELESFLEVQPFLAGPLAVLRSTLSKIYERQRSMYGCPVPVL